MLKNTAIIAISLMLSLGLVACGGSTTTVKQTETQGQQLVDLKEAYDQGIITEKEYQKTKEKILKGK